MNLKYEQRGSTLVIALIMLVVLTLLVISAMRSSNSNLRVVGNMQVQEEAVAAAQQVLEQTVSYNFAATPAASSVSVNLNNANYTVNVATPVCMGSTPLQNNTPNLPSECLSSGQVTNNPIISTSGVVAATTQSWCLAQQWEVQANAVNASTGATATVHQGVTMNVPVGTGC